MPARIRARLTYANVMATLALFVALGGGAYAAGAGAQPRPALHFRRAQ